jgi:phosphopantothenoylcysteine decarboxylase / phosphopantothenate---cysteine ligase
LSNILSETNIVLGVTGSISAYKSLTLASRLTQLGANVNVILTEGGSEFITPLSYRTITQNPVVTNSFDVNSAYSVNHVYLAKKTDVVIVYPATANSIAKLAVGICDNPLATTILSTAAPIIIAPAMETNMFENSITQSNIENLKTRGFHFIGPDAGHLASGALGLGRLTEPEEMLGHIQFILGKTRGDFSGKKIVITAGGTQEPVDPVRILTNLSSGKMGYSLATAARDRGATVTLISAPVSLSAPIGTTIHEVKTAEDMLKSVHENIKEADAIIMAAAVADFKPTNSVGKKIKKSDDNFTMRLSPTSDILKSISDTKIIKVGFAAETDNLIENAKSKITSKKLAMIIANDVTIPGAGFGSDENQISIIDQDLNVESLPLNSKYEISHTILDRLLPLLQRFK